MYLVIEKDTMHEIVREYSNFRVLNEVQDRGILAVLGKLNMF